MINTNTAGISVITDAASTMPSLPMIDKGSEGIVLAASVITLIPAVFVFIIGQDELEAGMISSGIKE